MIYFYKLLQGARKSDKIKIDDESVFQVLIYRGEVTNKKWSLLKKLRKTYNQLRDKISRKLCCLVAPNNT
jgi:hypothetical protein